jgi:hypothetical protein
MLRRLHQVNWGILGRVIKESNVQLLKRLCLRRRVMLAMDYKTLPYYGAEQPVLISDSRLPRTRLGMRFAILSIVEAGRTFTIGMRQVGPFTSKVEVLREMLEDIHGLVEPKIILFDRAFFTVEVMKALKSKKRHFLMPAKRTAPIKRLCKAFEKGRFSPSSITP